MKARKFTKIEKPSPWTYIQQEFPKDEDGVIYVRQSSMVQMQNNIHSFEMQTDKFVEHFRNMGCTGYIEIIADDEGMSGTKDIHERRGLSRVMRLIEGKELLKSGRRIRWIAAVAVNRFTRDPWLITPGVLMKSCHAHDIWVATLRMHFNFKDPYCQRVFMLEAEEAARYLDWMKLILGGGKATASNKGFYDGRWLVPGYIVDRTDPLRKKYIIYEPHAKVVRWLFRRFFELDGDLYELCREIDKMPFLFPAFESWVDRKNITRFAGSRKRGGSLITEGPYAGNYKPSESGIRSILCNPVYIGWWIPLEGGVIENNHEAIINETLFIFAYKRLSAYDLKGERQKPERTTRPGQAKGILKKVLRDGNDEPMYAQPSSESGAYFYKSMVRTNLARTYEFSIGVEKLERIFLEKFFERTEALEKIDNWEDKIQEIRASQEEAKEESRKRIVDSIEEARLQRQETMNILDDRKVPKTTQMKIDYALKIAGLEQKIARLQSLLEQPEEEEENDEITLYEIHSLLPNIMEKWDKLLFGIRLRFVGALVRKVVLTQVAPSWFKFEIHWKDAIGNFVDVAFFKKPTCNRTSWTTQEETILREMYPKEDAAIIIDALPERSWSAIMSRAEKLGIKRDRNRRPNSIPATDDTLRLSSEADRIWEEQAATEWGVSPTVSSQRWYRPLH